MLVQNLRSNFENERRYREIYYVFFVPVFVGQVCKMTSFLSLMLIFNCYQIFERSSPGFGTFFFLLLFNLYFTIYPAGYSVNSVYEFRELFMQWISPVEMACKIANSDLSQRPQIHDHGRDITSSTTVIVIYLSWSNLLTVILILHLHWIIFYRTFRYNLHKDICV